MLRGWPRLTPMHVMAHTNGFAFVALSAAIAAKGELSELPPSVPWGTLVLYGCSAWAGVCAFILLTREWGATAAVLTTNTRKLVTVVLSFVIFPKPVTPAFLLSGCVIIAGICLHSYGRRRNGHKTTATKVAKE